MRSAFAVRYLPAALLTLAMLTGLALAGARVQADAPVAAVFAGPPGAALLALPAGWTVLRLTGPRWLPVLLLRPRSSGAADLAALRSVPGLLLLLGASGVAGCAAAPSLRI